MSRAKFARIAAVALGSLALLAPGSASAALRVGQLFVRGLTLEALAGEVEAYLGTLGESASEGRARRRIVVIEGRGAAPERAWHLLLDSTGGGVDPRLADHLARREGAAVLRVEVDGGSLSWLRARSRAGRMRAPRREPEAGYGGAPTAGPMPRYVDVEAAAARWLRVAGVERRLSLVGLSQLQPPAEGRGGRVAVTFEIPRGGSLRRQEVQVALPERPGSLPPVAADATLPPALGFEGVRIDLLTLTGEPTAPRVRHLARVLRGIERRARRALSAPLCHLAQGRYRRPLYRALERLGGPCRAVYRRLLERLDAEEAGSAGALRPRLPEAQGE